MRIAICGGGIGGLACAVGLRGQGFEVDVYESAAKFAPIGAGITLAFNAMQVMRGLGLADEVMAAGHRMLRGMITDRQLGVLVSNGMEELEEEFGVPFTGIARSKLHEILIAALPGDRLHLGKALERYENRPAGAVAYFADGSQVEADVLICADGLHSAGRRQMYPNIEPRYAKQTSWRGMLPRQDVALEPHQALEAWGRGTRFGTLHVSEEETYWFAVANSKAGQKPGHHADHKSDAMAFMKGYHPTLAAMVEKTDPAKILRTDIWDLPTLPAWHQGRVVLIGDAAHATTPNLGQGAAQALEDAYCLALCLARFQPEEALPKFWEWRHQKAEMVVNTSRRFGWVGGWNHPLSVRLRNKLLSLAPPSQGTEAVRQLGRLDWLERLNPVGSGQGAAE